VRVRDINDVVVNFCNEYCNCFDMSGASFGEYTNTVTLPLEIPAAILEPDDVHYNAKAARFRDF